MSNELSSEPAGGAAPPVQLPAEASAILPMSEWEQGIWLWVARGLAVIGLVLIIFVAGTLIWITREVTILGGKDLAFSFSSIALLSLTLLRFLAILIGAGMVFGGLVVSFFAHAKTSTLGAQGSVAGSPTSFNLATASPGLAAIVVGALVIVAALYAKGDHKYVAAPMVINSPQSTKVLPPSSESPLKAADDLGK